MNSTRAFSLIELLVVVAVIAVLMSLVVPTVSHFKQASQSTRSLNHLRQIGVALNAFIGENNGFIMPRAYASAAAAPAGQSRYWTATLYNRGYLQDKQVFYDPRFPPYGPPAEGSSQSIEKGTPATYGMRDWVRPGETIGSTTTRVAKPVAIVEKPSDFFIVADSYWEAWKTQGYGISSGEASPNRVRLDRQGTAGTLFLDGHVERKEGAYFEELGQTQGEYSDGQPFATWQQPD